MPLTSQLKNRLLEALVGNDSMLGGSIYVGLSSTAPNADGTNITEPTTGGYKRVLIGSSSQTATQRFGEPENFIITNDEEIYFPESTGSWGNALTHFVLYNSATGTAASNILAFEELKDENGVASPITVSGEKTVVMFRTGKLKITLSD